MYNFPPIFAVSVHFPLFRENDSFPPYFYKFPPALRKFTCFLHTLRVLFSPYFDHDALMHHPMHVLDAHVYRQQNKSERRHLPAVYAKKQETHKATEHPTRHTFYQQRCCAVGMRSHLALYGNFTAITSFRCNLIDYKDGVWKIFHHNTHPADVHFLYDRNQPRRLSQYPIIKQRK